MYNVIKLDNNKNTIDGNSALCMGQWKGLDTMFVDNITEGVMEQPQSWAM